MSSAGGTAVISLQLSPRAEGVFLSLYVVCPLALDGGDWVVGYKNQIGPYSDCEAVFQRGVTATVFALLWQVWR